MKIIILLASIWSLSTSLSAVELSRDNRGEVLIFPLFNTNNGWDSLISISAQPYIPNIFRVRVREGENGAQVNTFYVYNSPAESWRASISKRSNGEVVLTVAEGSCMVTENLEFGGPGFEYSLGASIGTIEVYSVGAVLTSYSWDSEPDCTDIAERWRPLQPWRNDPSDGLQEITVPKISGEMNLVNVGEGLAAGYTATALDHFNDQFSHTFPWDASPHLGEAEPVATASNGVDVVPESGEGIDAVAMVLGLGGQSTISNDVIVADSIGARTDWILSYPLDGYKNYRPFPVSIEGSERQCETFGIHSRQGEPSFEIPLDKAIASLVSWANGINTEDEKWLAVSEFDPMPTVTHAVPTVCNAVNIISFEGKDSILIPLDAPNLIPLSRVTASDVSQLRWRLVEPVFPAMSGIRRPVLGFRLTTFVNGTLDGGNVLANYAVLRPHVRQ